MLWRGGHWWTCVWAKCEDYLALAWEDLLVDERYDIAEFVAYAIPILGGLVKYRTGDCRGYQIGTWCWLWSTFVPSVRWMRREIAGRGKGILGGVRWYRNVLIDSCWLLAVLILVGRRR